MLLNIKLTLPFQLSLENYFEISFLMPSGWEVEIDAPIRQYRKRVQKPVQLRLCRSFLFSKEPFHQELAAVAQGKREDY